MIMDISRFTTKEALFDHLHRNKDMIKAQKKSIVKSGDCFSHCHVDDVFSKGDSAVKSASPEELLQLDSINIKSVINTTNLFDSHYDVHIDKIWNKTLKEQSVFYLVKEHKFDFDNTLSDDVKAYVKTMEWKSLGFEYEGRTQALIFDSVLRKSDNPKMFEKYVLGKVRNHSVGMQYVKLFLAINSTASEYKEEKEVWDKYYDVIANKEDVDNAGFFWAVTEAKIIEGSAVMRGSNFATPTLDVHEEKSEPSTDTLKTIAEPTRSLSFLETIGSKI